MRTMMKFQVHASNLILSFKGFTIKFLFNMLFLRVFFSKGSDDADDVAPREKTSSRAATKKPTKYLLVRFISQ